MSSYSSGLGAKRFPGELGGAFDGIPELSGWKRIVKNADFYPYKIGISLHKYKRGGNFK